MALEWSETAVRIVSSLPLELYFHGKRKHPSIIRRRRREGVRGGAVAWGEWHLSKHTTSVSFGITPLLHLSIGDLSRL
jgi:hypothetical protein